MHRLGESQQYPVRLREGLRERRCDEDWGDSFGGGPPLPPPLQLTPAEANASSQRFAPRKR